MDEYFGILKITKGELTGGTAEEWMGVHVKFIFHASTSALSFLLSLRSPLSLLPPSPLENSSLVSQICRCSGGIPGHTHTHLTGCPESERCFSFSEGKISESS